MLKKIGLPAIALMGILAMAPHQANAAVRFGVGVAVAAPAYPVYSDCRPAPVAVVPDRVVVARRRWEPVVRWDRRHDFRFRR